MELWSTLLEQLVMLIEFRDGKSSGREEECKSE